MVFKWSCQTDDTIKMDTSFFAENGEISQSYNNFFSPVQSQHVQIICKNVSLGALQGAQRACEIP